MATISYIRLYTRTFRYMAVRSYKNVTGQEFENYETYLQGSCSLTDQFDNLSAILNYLDPTDLLCICTKIR